MACQGNNWSLKKQTEHLGKNKNKKTPNLTFVLLTLVNETKSDLLFLFCTSSTGSLS